MLERAIMTPRVRSERTGVVAIILLPSSNKRPSVGLTSSGALSYLCTSSFIRHDGRKRRHDKRFFSSSGGNVQKDILDLRRILILCAASYGGPRVQKQYIVTKFCLTARQSCANTESAERETRTAKKSAAQVFTFVATKSLSAARIDVSKIASFRILSSFSIVRSLHPPSPPPPLFPRPVPPPSPPPAPVLRRVPPMMTRVSRHAFVEIRPRPPYERHLQCDALSVREGA